MGWKTRLDAFERLAWEGQPSEADVVDSRNLQAESWPPARGGGLVSVTHRADLLSPLLERLHARPQHGTLDSQLA